MLRLLEVVAEGGFAEAVEEVFVVSLSDAESPSEVVCFRNLAVFGLYVFDGGETAADESEELTARAWLTREEEV